MQRPFACLMMSLLGLLGAACDREGRPMQQAGLEKLAIGISSEGDVRNAMGAPETTWEDEDGSRILEYPKGPEGARTWIFTLDAKGRLVEYHQALTEENFARIRPGMRRDDVRRLLGKPRTVLNFKRMQEEVWDYRYTDSFGNRLFNVHLDAVSGRVTRTSTSEIGN